LIRGVWIGRTASGPDINLARFQHPFFVFIGEGDLRIGGVNIAAEIVLITYGLGTYWLSWVSTP
jgi:hypothetical protein